MDPILEIDVQVKEPCSLVSFKQVLGYIVLITVLSLFSSYVRSKLSIKNQIRYNMFASLLSVYIGYYIYSYLAAKDETCELTSGQKTISNVLKIWTIIVILINLYTFYSSMKLEFSRYKWEKRTGKELSDNQYKALAKIGALAKKQNMDSSSHVSDCNELDIHSSVYDEPK